MLCHVQQFQGLPRNVSFDIDALEAIWFAIRVLWNGRNKMIFKMVDVQEVWKFERRTPEDGY